MCKSRDHAHLMSIPPSSIFASSRKRPAVIELREALKRTRGMPFIHLMKISRKIMAKKYGITYGGSIRSSERERERNLFCVVWDLGHVLEAASGRQLQIKKRPHVLHDPCRHSRGRHARHVLHFSLPNSSCLLGEAQRLTQPKIFRPESGRLPPTTKRVASEGGCGHSIRARRPELNRARNPSSSIRYVADGSHCCAPEFVVISLTSPLPPPHTFTPCHTQQFSLVARPQQPRTVRIPSRVGRQPPNNARHSSPQRT